MSERTQYWCICFFCAGAAAALFSIHQFCLGSIDVGFALLYGLGATIGPRDEVRR